MKPVTFFGGCSASARVRAIAVAAGLMALSSIVFAQDGSLRQRFKERWQQRQSQSQPASAPGDDTATSAPITRPGDHTFTLEHQGETRRYRVHVPPSYDPARPMPLLFALHGGGGNMALMAKDANYGLPGKADQEGFIVVFPNGHSRFASGHLSTWNAGRCCGNARDENIDDVGFIRRIAEQLTRRMNIDAGRVYATGMSNGAMMAYRLACELPDLIRGVAAVAGTDNTNHCEPSRGVPVLHIHAKDDPHVLFGGGAGPKARRKEVVTDHTSVAATVSKWVAINGCAPAPKRVTEVAGAHCERYSPCSAQAPVQLCVTETGGHAWPGGKKALGGESGSQAISANDVMWDFFKQLPAGAP